MDVSLFTLLIQVQTECSWTIPFGATLSLRLLQEQSSIRAAVLISLVNFSGTAMSFLEDVVDEPAVLTDVLAFIDSDASSGYSGDFEGSSSDLASTIPDDTPTPPPVELLSLPLNEELMAVPNPLKWMDSNDLLALDLVTKDNDRLQSLPSKQRDYQATSSIEKARLRKRRVAADTRRREKKRAEKQALHRQVAALQARLDDLLYERRTVRDRRRKEMAETCPMALQVERAWERRCQAEQTNKHLRHLVSKQLEMAAGLKETFEKQQDVCKLGVEVELATRRDEPQWSKDATFPRGRANQTEAKAFNMVVKVGDTVLAYHGLMIYDARVQKVDNGQGVEERVGESGPTSASTQYYLHYQGWAKKWDEWVRHDRVLEDNAASRALQKKAKIEVALAKKEKRMAKKKKISSAGIDASSARKSPLKRMKRTTDQDYEEFPEPGDPNAEDTPTADQVNIHMPFALKKQLVEDWKQITHSPHLLVPLPRKPNVSQIIKTYLEFKKAKVHEGEASEEKEFKNVEGIMEGVQSYFDRALSSILLYRMERRQYQEIRQKHGEDTPLSQIYGAEHLIRLFGSFSSCCVCWKGNEEKLTLWFCMVCCAAVRLPILMASAHFPPRELNQIQARLNDFLKFVQKNSAAWFVTEYEAVTDKYVEQTSAST
ncbi:hypothetical protein BBJ28_00018273 [Nothophytophthora sp. Chile5]|nr:hypothetical protein BBJ28_00018273 [Nothophytophthora sp. Chile5]